MHVQAREEGFCPTSSATKMQQAVATINAKDAASLERALTAERTGTRRQCVATSSESRRSPPRTRSKYIWRWPRTARTGASAGAIFKANRKQSGAEIALLNNLNNYFLFTGKERQCKYVLLVRKFSGDMLWACAGFLVKVFLLIWPIERETRELRVCTLSVAQVFQTASMQAS